MYSTPNDPSELKSRLRISETAKRICGYGNGRVVTIGTECNELFLRTKTVFLVRRTITLPKDLDHSEM